MSLLVQASLECTHMHVNFGLYAHTLCANFGLNEHTLYANFGVYAYTLYANFSKWTHTVCKFRIICTHTLCKFWFKWSHTLCKFCGTTNLFSGHLRAPIEDIHTFSNFQHKIIELLRLCAFKSIFAYSVCVHLSTSIKETLVNFQQLKIPVYYFNAFPTWKIAWLNISNHITVHEPKWVIIWKFSKGTSLPLPQFGKIWCTFSG